VLAQENSPEAEQERIIKKPDDYKPKITLEGPLEKDASVESGDSASLDPSSEDKSIVSDFILGSAGESIVSGFDGSILSMIRGKKEEKEKNFIDFFDKMHVLFGIGFCENYGDKPIRKQWQESHGEVSVDWKYFDFRYLYQNRMHNKIYDTTPDSYGEYDFSYLDPDYDPGERYSLFRDSRVTQTFFSKFHFNPLYHFSGFYEFWNTRRSLLPTDPEPYFNKGKGTRGGGSFRVGSARGTGVEAFLFFSDEEGDEDHPASTPTTIERKSASLNGFLEGTFFFMLKKNVMQYVTIFAGALSSGERLEEDEVLTEDSEIMEPFVGISTRTLGKGFGIYALFTVNYENRTSEINENRVYYYTPLYCCASFQLSDGFSIVAHGRYLENKYPGGGFGFHIGNILEKRNHFVLLDYHLDRGRRIMRLDGHNSDNLRAFEDSHGFDTMINRIHTYRTTKNVGSFLLLQGEIYKGPNCAENQYNFSIEGAFGSMVFKKDDGMQSLLGLAVKYIDDQTLYQRILAETHINIGPVYIGLGTDIRRDRELEEFKKRVGFGVYAKLGITF
ncbi:hypothetical protein KY335_01095, partial [Candidatus Woesearchaeota archaeon]|nr:hypothetical protein [Candidatus Woesearchaeota archaeon]